MGFLSKLRGIPVADRAVLVGGPVMLVAGWKESKDSKALSDHGVVTDAVVTEVTWSTKRSRERNFHAKITFITPDNRTINEDVSVSNDLGQQLRDAPEDKASTLSVRYLPEDPSTVALADHKDESAFLYGVGAILLLIGIGILVYRLRKPSGEPATA